MSIRYPQLVTIETQIKKAEEKLKIYKTQLEIVNKVFPILEKFQGKKITKHIETAVKKEFPNHWVYLDNSINMYHLKIQPKGEHLEYENVSMLLGYQASGGRYTPDVLLMVQVYEFNKCYTLNSERIPRLEAGIKKIPSIVELRDKALKILAEMIVQAEKYEMDYDFDLEK
jgi:hypothetical protein